MEQQRFRTLPGMRPPAATVQRGDSVRIAGQEDAMVVGDICNREVIIVEREGSILEAAKLMRKYHVGNVIVVDDRDGVRIPVGILTDRDIVIGVLADSVDIDAVTIGDAMSFELLTAREDDDPMETIKRMRIKGVRRIPVVDRRGGLVGVLAVDDLVEILSEQLTDLAGLITREQQRERTYRS